MSQNLGLSLFIISSFIIAITVQAEPAAISYTLDNGMTVVLKEVHTAPVIAMQMWCNRGSIHENEYLGYGISHFMEHMLFKGTEKRKVNQIAQEIREAGGELNAYTSIDRLVFHIVIGSNHFDTGLDIIADVTMHSTFEPAEFEKEKQVILKEINMNLDAPDRIVSRLFWSTAYSVHPYRHPVIGYRELFTQVTRDDLVKYYQRTFVPNNLTLVIVGDFKMEEVKPKIESAFKEFTRKELAPIYIPEEPPQIGLRRAEVEKEVNQTYLEMGYHIPSIYSDDVYPLDVLAVLLGEGNSSRLYQQIKEKLGLVHSINVWSLTPTYPGIFGISATLNEEKRIHAESAIFDEIKKIQTHPIPDTELLKAKKMIASSFIFRQETVQGQAGQLGNDAVTMNNIHYSETYLDKIRQVTAEDVQRVAIKYLRPENLTIAVLKPKTESEIQKTEVRSQQETERKKIKKVILPSGLTVLIKENHDLPLVSIRLVFKGGVVYETDQNNGICNLLQRMLLKGTKNRTAEQIAESIAQVGGKIDTYSGNNSFGVTIDILKDDLSLGLDILSDIVLNPIFPESALEIERQHVLAAIRSQEDDVFPAAMKLLRETLFTVHPYRRLTIGTESTVATITRNDIIQFYKQLCVPKNAVLAIFGDISTETVLNQIQKVFESFDTPIIPYREEITESPITAIRTTTKTKEKQQTVILIGYHGIKITDPRRYTSEVMNAILSGQGSRLFDTIREKQGLAYYVGMIPVLGLDPGMYIFYVGTETDKIEIAIKSILAEIERIKSEDVTDEELIRAKKELIGNKAIDTQTNSAQAFESALDELYGLGYDNLDQYAMRINAVTKDDIRKLANDLFKPNAYALVVVKPKSKNHAILNGQTSE
ncbi:MAG: insulinase family protein [bacterium]|nr:insulinase family protein [bacterium]